MADETGKQNVNLDEAAAAAAGGGSTSTQTREGEADKDAGKGKSSSGGDDGTGNGDGGSSGSQADADALTADKDGKVAHPDTKELVDPLVVANYYRTKFGESTKGAQDLLAKVTTAEGEVGTYKGQVDKLTKDLEDIKAVAEGKNPEGLKAHEIQAKLNETTEALALIRESQSLDAFEKSTPLATGTVRESLKALARANPKSSLKDLYDANLKAGADAAEVARLAKIEAQKKGASDQGKGTSTREPAAGGKTVTGSKGDTGLTLEEFNALPVSKRRDLIAKHGISM